MKRNEHNKSVGSKIERSDERINATSEVFTPMEVCIKIIQEIPEMMLKDSKSRFCRVRELPIGSTDRIIKISFFITYQR